MANNFHRFCGHIDDFEIVVLPARVSTLFEPGMLVVWDGTNNYIEPISLGTAGLSDTVAYIGAAFAGVCIDGKLASDATTGRPGSNGVSNAVTGLKVAQVCLYKAACASTAFDHGATVHGVVGATGDYTVAAGATSGSIIGTVYGQYTSATTSVRVKLFGKFASSSFADQN